MKPEEIKTLGDVFKSFGEQIADLEKTIGPIPAKAQTKQELCETCGLPSDQCDCDEQFI